VKRTIRVAIAVLATVLAAQPRPSSAGSVGSASDVKIRELEEQVRRIQQELETIREEQKATQEEQKATQEEQKATKARVDLMPKVEKWIANLEWLNDVKFSGSVTVRYDDTHVEDRQDLHLENDEIGTWRTRDRFGVTYQPDGPILAGIRLSTGANVNPTVPFINLGDGFRTKNIYFDRFYFIVRPLKFFDKTPWNQQPYQISVLVGKMPQPFWLGDHGAWASESVWDQDVNPEGFALKIAAPQLAPHFGMQATGAYYALEQVEDLRFTGLTADTYMAAGQILGSIEPAPRTMLNLAFTVNDFQNLNAGARSPVFDPANTVVTPGQSAFLLRPGFQVTNNRHDLGVGAVAFAEPHFLNLNPAVELTHEFPTFKFPTFNVLTPQLFVYGEYIHNVSVSRDQNGWGASIGFDAGQFGSDVNPFQLWFTYRDVDNDATLATFADSDLGAGTGYKGFEVAGYYRLHKNLQFQISYFDFNGFPFKKNGIERVFFDMTAGF